MAKKKHIKKGAQISAPLLTSQSYKRGKKTVHLYRIGGAFVSKENFTKEKKKQQRKGALRLNEIKGLSKNKKLTSTTAKGLKTKRSYQKKAQKEFSLIPSITNGLSFNSIVVDSRLDKKKLTITIDGKKKTVPVSQTVELNGFFREFNSIYINNFKDVVGGSPVPFVSTPFNEFEQNIDFDNIDSKPPKGVDKKTDRAINKFNKELKDLFKKYLD